MRPRSRAAESRPASRRHARGAALIVSLIVLVVFTFIVVSASNLSLTNAKAVGNEQSRSEAIAAANRYMEQLISTAEVFTAAAPGGYQTTVSFNNDNTQPISYVVQIAEPVCLRAVRAAPPPPSDVEFQPAISTASTWDVDFELTAVVNDAATGTALELRQGVRRRLSQSDRVARCGPIPP